MKALQPVGTAPSTVATEAREVAAIARTQLDEAIESDDVPSPTDVVREILIELRRQPPRDWHSAAVLYWRLDAARRDLDDETKNLDITQRLDSLLGFIETQLRFQNVDSQRPAFDGLSIPDDLLGQKNSVTTP